GIYATTIAPLTAAGDGDLNYRIYASDGVHDAEGEPTGNSAVRVIAPSVTFGSAAQTTVNESGAAPLTVQQSSASGEAVTVPFTVNGSSTATGGGVDYHITASPIAIAAGSTTANITISLISDTLNENNETVVVDMGAPTNAVRGAITTHTLTITDDDPAPTVIFTTSSQATAGEDGTATITAQLSAASGKDVTVPFTVNGSSTATGGGFDYSMSASPVTIPAGSTTADITVSITSDNLDEDHETVIVDMGAPTNATQGAITTHALTITDDAPAPAVTFTTASQMTAMESGSYTITAQLSAASGRVVTVPFTVNATSTATGGGVDYHITASPIAIAAGSTTANITMTIIADSLVEGNETVIVDMGAPINATQGAITTHTLTIRDDDGAQIAVCSTNPAPFNKIQTTIADAGTTNGSTLLVCAGTYPEKINFLGKDITVKAESGASVTFIIGDNTNSPVVTFSSGENSTAVLDGFTIDNQAAAGTATRGISISASSAPTIRNCVVKGNQLSTGQNGAGIYINGGTATIQSSTIGGEAFNKNSCQTGCGIYATALTETLSISNSTISENAGTGTGGGIYLSANGTQATNITGTAFTNNTGQNGGAIYNNGTILSISGSSSFNANSVSSGTGGGAIHSTGAGASTTIDGATFTGNASSNQGGAIYITGSTAATPLSISNCTFTNNAATLYGAAVALNSITNATTISSTTITGGSGGSSSKGAGIYTSAAPLTLTNTNVNNNTSALEGGGIWASGAASVITITGGSVSGNSGTSGSGIYLTSSATLTATGTTISNNTSSSTSGSGGGIYAANGVTITDGTFANNAAGSSSGQGGAIYSSSSVTLNGANTFTGNHASNGGGAIFLSSGSVAVNNSGNIFTGNYTTSNSGGAIFVTDGGSVAFAGIAGAIFTGNYATNAGGGAIITGNATIHNATFTGNYAKDNGGAFYPLSGTSYIYNSTFETNSLTTTSTTYGGGAIYMKNAVYYLNIYNSTFVGNSAGAGRGGAVYANTNASANIYNSTFYNNTSSYSSPVNHLHASSSGYIKLYNALVAHPSGAVLCNNTARGGTSVNLEYNNSGTACAASSVTGDPKLSVLADNGGLTRTMALQTGSAAMDAADDATCLTTDQRGLSRPVDGDSNGSAVCDIGAFEYVP
ncbi:MAG: hypothetical protein FIA94_07995, partial [Nitrospirae bacterium]|nr:hypothetical protein [Nitrospirota bacterium]